MAFHSYQRSPADKCIYVKTFKRDDGFISFVILAVYVDDIIPVSNDVEMLKAEKESPCKEFEMVDLREIHFILGMSNKRDRATRTLTISQGQYLKDLLKRFGMEECKPVSTLLESGKKFHKRADEEERCDKSIYQQAIGCLTYVSTATRPDIAAAVVTLSQFMSDTSKEHWMGVKRVLRYIKGTPSYGLKFTVNVDECDLYGFSDADWAGDADNRWSTSGYVFKVANSTVSWCCKKQATVAKSTTEAEYVALSQATQEAIYFRKLLADLGCKADSPTVLKDNNQGAIELPRNLRFHHRTKHIDVAFHFIRERIASNEVKVVYCPSNEMLADIMTKGLASKSQRLDEHLCLLEHSLFFCYLCKRIHITCLSSGSVGE